MRRTNVVASALIFATLSVSAVPADEAKPAESQQRAEKILAQTSGAEGIFATTEDWSLKHVQSGLVCPLTFPNASLVRLYIYAPDGTDVGCDYARPATGKAVSKLTVFAVRTLEGETLDSIFAKYKGEVEGSMPSAKSRGPAIHFDGNNAKTKEMASIVRSEEYEVSMGGSNHISDLIVALVGDWAIEIRATFSATANNAVDLGGPALAMVQAIDSVMSEQSGPKSGKNAPKE